MRIVLLSLALLGYYGAFCMYYPDRKPYFLLSFIAFSTLTGLIFGILEHLILGFWFVIIIGILLLIVLTARHLFHKSFAVDFRCLFQISILFCCIAGIWLFAITRNTAISHWDDCTHWYRICKMIFAEKRLPSMPDMDFPTYVPGTAIWINFITYCIGFSVPNCFFAQGMVNVACCSCLFSLIPKREKQNKSVFFISVLFCCVVSVALCAFEFSTYSLTVDTLVALVPLSCFCFIITKRSDSLSYVLLALILSFAAQIKNSGLIFIFFISIAYYFANQGTERFSIVKSIGLVVPPVVFDLAFWVHVRQVFGDVSNTGHAVSVSRFLSNFSEKNGQQLLQIIKSYFAEVFNFGSSYSSVRLIWVCLALSILFVIILNVFNKSEVLHYIKKWTIYYFLIVGLYFLGLLVSYLFAFQTTVLASFNRYMASAAIFVFGVISANIMWVIAHTEFSEKGQFYSLLAFLVAFSLFISPYLDYRYIWGRDYAKAQYTDQQWKYCSALFAEQWNYNEKQVAVFQGSQDFPGESYGKTMSMIQTYLRTTNVEVFNTEEVASHQLTDAEIDFIRNSDYYVFLKDHSEIYELLSEYIPNGEFHVGLCTVK